MEKANDEIEWAPLNKLEMVLSDAANVVHMMICVIDRGGPRDQEFINAIGYAADQIQRCVKNAEALVQSMMEEDPEGGQKE